MLVKVGSQELEVPKPKPVETEVVFDQSLNMRDTKFSLYQVEEHKDVHPEVIPMRAVLKETVQKKVSTKDPLLKFDKEQCELPLVKLSEFDEQVLFNIGVNLKFADYKGVIKSANELESHIFDDYPLETFL